VLVDQKADPQRVIIISFYPEVIAECRRRIPRFQAHLISALKGIREEGKAAEVERLIQTSGAQGLQFDCNSAFDTEWTLGLKKRGLGLASWAVDDVATAKKVTDAGVDFITTNRPGPLRKELGGS
jgi:glycerophosphoryl diester phosphodiesterase